MRFQVQLFLLLAFCSLFVLSTAGYSAKIVYDWDAAEAEWQARQEALVAAERAEAEMRLAALDAAAKAEEQARQAGLEAVRVRAAAGDYEAARWDPLHFAPAIDDATDEQCLVCHAEILERRPLEQSPAGVKASEALAWYQTLDTYQGEQDTLHRRHLVTPLAEELMTLNCNFCHRGLDPREEAPSADLSGTPPFTLRKMVNPSETCLRCHGRFPNEVMVGVEGPWHEVRQDFEFEEGENGCLVCHADLFRTVRHQVTYLKPEAIEAAAQSSSDVCYGCHGGRSWYRISYPYPRHPWPDMDEAVPEWATDRPTESDPRDRPETE